MRRFLRRVGNEPVLVRRSISLKLHSELESSALKRKSIYNFPCTMSTRTISNFGQIRSSAQFISNFDRNFDLSLASVRSCRGTEDEFNLHSSLIQCQANPLNKCLYMTPSVQRRRRRQSIVNQGIIQYRSCDLTSVVVEPFFFWQCGSILGYIGSVKIYGLFGKLSAQRDVVEISRKLNYLCSKE